MTLEQNAAIDPVDRIVGNNIRERRRHLGITQDALGKGIGLTFQQVQKYERGQNRVSASALHKIAKVLRCTLTDLFKGANDIAAAEGESEGETSGAMTGTWLADAQRIDQNNPRLLSKLSRLPRRHLADLERVVDAILSPVDLALEAA